MSKTVISAKKFTTISELLRDFRLRLALIAATICAEKGELEQTIVALSASMYDAAFAKDDRFNSLSEREKCVLFYLMGADHATLVFMRDEDDELKED